MKRKFLLYSLGVFTILFHGCYPNRDLTSPEGQKRSNSVSSPPVIIYSTLNDYRLFVPVIMDSLKKAIISYPSPADLIYRGQPSFPTELTDGFLLDNRGINQFVAFLDITYDEYKKLNPGPHVNELLKHIQDNDPLKVMYQCGRRSDYINLSEELNYLITTENFNRCLKLK